MNSTDRYDRQRRFAPIGREGQARIESSSVLVVGCGALGGALAQTLVRVGVGELILVDRDLVEPTNLARQVLFDERHARESRPKAEAAAETLAAIGGATRIRAHSAHVDASNVAEFASGVDLMLDGTDNLATRYLLNDFAVRERKPWIYAGVVGASGLVLPVWPGRGACLACFFPEPPPAEQVATCDTAGVILPAVSAVAAVQASFALRWLAADGAARDSIESRLIEIDVWKLNLRQLSSRRDPECPVCVQREFRWLERDSERDAVVLCGRNTVQVRPPSKRRVDLAQVAAGIAGSAERVERSSSFLRFAIEGFRVTLFGDGRALVEGTEDRGRARGVYDRWIGS